MRSIASLHLRLAVIYGVLGMALGLHMGISQDHGQLVTHAHLNLVGWVSTALFGLVLRAYADRPMVGLAWVQFALSHIGVVVMVVGLYLIFGGNPEGGEIFASIGSVLTLLGMVLFAVIVYRLTRD
jgi:hypothetical protein